MVRKKKGERVGFKRAKEGMMECMKNDVWALRAIDEPLWGTIW